MNDEPFQPAKAVFMVTSVDFRALLATLNLVPRSLVADADEDLPLTAVFQPNHLKSFLLKMFDPNRKLPYIYSIGSSSIVHSPQIRKHCLPLFDSLEQALLMPNRKTIFFTSLSFLRFKSHRCNVHLVFVFIFLFQNPLKVCVANQIIVIYTIKFRK